jgi:integral membrane protein
LTRYRVMAYVTGVLLIVLFFVVVPVDAVSSKPPAWTNPIGLVHGLIAYPLYLITVYDMYRRLKWPLGRLITVVLCGVVPFLSFVMERKIVHELGDGRSAPAADPAEDPAEATQG